MNERHIMFKNIKNYLKLIRVKHWFKNIIIFIPAFYGGTILEKTTMINSIIGFFVFSLLSSAVYVLNDICDAEKDRLHPVKCDRPIASGAVSEKQAGVILALCILLPLTADILFFGIRFWLIIPVLYLILNISYSIKLKNKPVIDLVILVSGFVLRLIYGAGITGVKISNWLYLTLIALSLFMAFGKRRNEKIHCGDATRSVLGKYSDNYLNSNMYMYLGLFLVFYALWSMDTTVVPNMIYTTPIVIIIMMRYTYSLEKDETGNPVDMILGDKMLLALGVIYGIYIFVQLYFPEAVNEYLRF